MRRLKSFNPTLPRGTFLLDLGEGLVGCDVVGFHIGHRGEPPDDHVTIVWIELDTVAAPAGLFGGDQRGAATGEARALLWLEDLCSSAMSFPSLI